MSWQYYNSVLTYLTYDIGDTDTFITVDDATGWTLGPDFTINITGELIKVTGVAGNVLTVVRAQEGTTAAAYPAHTPVLNVITAAMLPGPPGATGTTGATGPAGPSSSPLVTGRYAHIAYDALTTADESSTILTPGGDAVLTVLTNPVLVPDFVLTPDGDVIGA